MERYMSRKFLITLSVVGATTFLAFHSRVDANVALVFSACVAAYNWANLRVVQNGSAPK